MNGSNLIPIVLRCVLILAMTGICLKAAEPPPGPPADSKPAQLSSGEPAANGVWQGSVGQGFGSAVQSFSVEPGACYGLAVFGSRQQHDMGLMSLSYGHILSRIEGQGHWYRGNWEFRAELFGGAQLSPAKEWITGLTPHLRYDFATGTRWVPFVDGGAGVTGTGIGGPDLSNRFEFNLQGGGGVHWFFKDNVALTLEVRYIHLSCAEISSPNLGVNGLLGTVGLSRFF
ncbi:MAG: acyloxyacyl hydrolase [Limisphaerales bacterium]